jgi:hypothetical protein
VPEKNHEYEVFPKPEDKQRPPFHPIPAKPPKKPEVAIIIDDIGYNRELAEKFADLGIAITFSVLPMSPYTRTIAKASHQKGVEIMLHLPMEPVEYPRINPGPGALLVSMSPDELLHQLKQNLERVPYVTGVNNHMGSRLTSVSSRMYQVFSIVKKRQLFFIDSRTTSRSVCGPSARLFQISYAERDVFLDHLQTKQSIMRQISSLVKKAEKNGSAIGIGHPHTMTYEALRDTVNKYKSRVRFVHASKLVKIPGQTI